MKGLNYYIEMITDPKNKSILRLSSLLLVGAFILILNKFLHKPPTITEITEGEIKPLSTPTEEAQGALNTCTLEQRLSDVLGQVKGVKDVSVIITFEEEELLEPAFNITSNEKVSEEKDSEGGLRTVSEIQSTHQAIVLRQGNDDTAMVLKKLTPRIKGVLIVADGVDSSKTVDKITKATSALLDVPLYRVSVLPK